ncbi:MAG: ROK family protein [Thomasclavelia sp.]
MMDEFLRDIHTEIFYYWVLSQKRDFYRCKQDKHNCQNIIIEAENSQGIITFNKFNIIELTVTNKAKQKTEFYLHFQMKNLHHAKMLFEEMIETIKKISNTPTTKILLCCSGGLTTGFFAQKINETAKLLDLDIEANATRYLDVYEKGIDYDFILLAPQISYLCANIQKVLKNQQVIKIPPRVFAKYDVLKIINLVKDLSNKLPQYSKSSNRLLIKRDIQLKSMILCLSVYKNSGKVYIDYRIYDQNKKSIYENEIIKQTIAIEDVFDVLDIVLATYPDIKTIALSMPGIVNAGKVSSTFVANANNRDLQKELKETYQRDFILANDINAAAIGYYAVQERYNSFCFLFQPIGLDAGLGTVINGELVQGNYHLAGEVKFLPMQLSDDKANLNKTPEGIVELVSKMLITISSIIAPEVFIIYSDMVDDVNVIKNKIEDVFASEVEDFNIEIYKVEHLQEYILAGLMLLCAK